MLILKKYFNYIKRFIPRESAGCSVGLDIGPTECKVVAIQPEGQKAFQLLDCAIEPVTNGNVVEAVRQALSRIECSYEAVYSSVSGRGTLIRYIAMPRMSNEDLAHAFDIEVDKYFPFPRDQIYTDFYILDPHEKIMQMSVMVAACRREIIEDRMKLLTELGIKTHFIGINPVALANAFYVLGSEEETAIKDSGVALMDMGESVSTLTVFFNKQPRFTRDIFIGGRDFTKKISSVLNISFDEAEQIKNDPKDKLKQIVEAYEDVVLHMVHEMKLSFDYFSTEQNIDISHLFLTGGASLLEGISRILQKSLEVNVKPWDPLAGIKIASHLSREKMMRDSSKLGVALGLAFYHYDQD